MTTTLPQPDLSRFSVIPPETVVLSYLGFARGPVTPKTLVRALKSMLDETTCRQTLSALSADGKIALGERIEFTELGRVAAKKAVGRDAGRKSWGELAARRFPLLALGLDPDDAHVAQRFAQIDALRAGAISIAFGLSKQPLSSRNVVCAELVWRVLKSVLADTIGTGPFPLIEKPGVVERIILAGLANARARTTPETFAGLAAKSVGVEASGADSFRAGLMAVGFDQPEIKLGKGHTPEEANGFATRIKEVAGKLTTPPFQGRVAIAQVYDEYGRLHADAGPLATFKERLVLAARDQKITLSRLDLMNQMDRDLRLRSETAWDRDVVHFIITKWM